MRNSRNLLRKSSTYNQAEYQAWLFGLALTWMLYMLLFLFMISETVLPTWVWYIGVIYFVSGVFLSFSSKRLLWIRSFQLIGTMLITSVASALIWLLFRQGFSLGQILFIAVGFCLFLGGSIIYGYENVKRQGPNFGYGFMGTLSVKTGLLNPNQIPRQRKAEIERKQRLSSNWRRWSPIVAGLSVFLVNVLSLEAVKLFVALGTVLWLWLGTFGIGHMLYCVRWINQWEQMHAKQISLEH